MSMIAAYRRISERELTMLRANPDSVDGLLSPEDSEPDDGRHIDLDKSWHAIHYLLTGDPWGGEPPLFNAVLGGTPIGDDNGYGPARYLTAEQVRQVAVALTAISPENLRSRASLKEMAGADIYSVAPEEGESEWEYITDNYRNLVDFFRNAAAAGDAMLLCMT
jgi:hypothetical protein